MHGPYPGELRTRVIDFVEEGGSRREAAEQFDVSVSSAIRWVQRFRENGTFEPMPSGGSISLLEKHSRQILALISEESDLTLNERYEDFIEGLRPQTINEQMVFEPRASIFKRLCADASAQPNRYFFLIVDEINRGDVPRIFGEPITVIEQDKRGMSIVLPVTASMFAVPRNVFLIGTMNTADRSISMLDAALRRRFGFVELMPDSSRLAGRKAGGLPLGAWLDALNARLRQHLKRDARNLQIGHAYLLPPQPITSMV